MDNRLYSASAALNNVDLTNCDREPIHVPGSIQPHGLLLAFAEPDETVVTVSENVAALAGIPAEAVVGGPLDALFAAPGLSSLREALREPDPASANPLRLELTRRDGPPLACDGIIHRHDELTFLELEPLRDSLPNRRNWFQQIRLATQKL